MHEVHGAVGQSGPGKCRDGFYHIPKLPFLTPQLPNTQSISGPKQPEENGRAQRAEPVRLVVRRSDDKIERVARPLPYLAVFTGDDSEAVVPGCKVRILHLANIDDFFPVRVLAFEFVTEADLFGHGKAYGGKLDFQIADPRREMELRGDRASQVLPIELAIRGNLFDVHRRRQLVVREAPRINDADPLQVDEPQLSIFGSGNDRTVAGGRIPADLHTVRIVEKCRGDPPLRVCSP